MKINIMLGLLKKHMNSFLKNLAILFNLHIKSFLKEIITVHAFFVKCEDKG